MRLSSYGAQERSGQPYTIGQVLSRLKKEFPDLTSSKLRFLEDQKLINPARTASGYRNFYPADVQRIRMILSLQRDEYLPLKVIRARLDRLGSNLPDTAPQLMRREELLNRADVSAVLFTEAVTSSLIEASEYYGQDTLRMLSALAVLKKMGISPRNLSFLKNFVDKQTLLVQDAVMPLKNRRDETLTESTAAELLDSLQVIQELLMVKSRETLSKNYKPKVKGKGITGS